MVLHLLAFFLPFLWASVSLCDLSGSFLTPPSTQPCQHQPGSVLLELGLDCLPSCSTASDLQLAANAFGSSCAGRLVCSALASYWCTAFQVYVIAGRAGLCL
jgi:hypothetical protein